MSQKFFGNLGNMDNLGKVGTTKEKLAGTRLARCHVITKLIFVMFKRLLRSQQNRTSPAHAIRP